MHKKGDAVRIRFTTLTGVVTGFGTNDTGFLYLVDYIDKDGEPQSRYFQMDEIEAA